MIRKFEVEFLEAALDFLDQINNKARNKIIYNIDKASYQNDPRLFKKISENIWEFRTVYNGIQYRLFAFWHTQDNVKTLVVSTHGFIKKTKKIPSQEINRAEAIRKDYLENK